MTTTNTTTVLRPAYKTTYVSNSWSKVLLPKLLTALAHLD